MRQVGGNWSRGRGNTRREENKRMERPMRMGTNGGEGKTSEAKEAPERKENERKEVTRQMREETTGGEGGYEVKR